MKRIMNKKKIMFPFLIGRMLTILNFADERTVKWFPFLIGRMLTLYNGKIRNILSQVSIPYR